MMEEIIRKQVKSLKFNLISPEQVKKISKAKIVTPELYDIDGFPVDGGLMDLRLGVIDPGIRCRTDGATMRDCPGYPGHIELARPVVHIKYIPLIELILRSFNHKSGRLMLSEDKIKKYSPAERAKKAKDKKVCPYTGETQEKVKLEKPYSFYVGRKRLFPNEIREILINISDEELMKIGINSKNFRPEWAIMSQLLVPSVNVRPSITLDTGERSEDDLTHKLSDIIRANQRLWENLNAGAPEVIIEDLWDLLQYHVTTFFDNNITRIPPARHRSGQPLKTITERIKGKEGRIRKNLAGKRVNFSGRTVASPDPYIGINEIGIPFQVAKIITVVENVTSINIKTMEALIKRADEHPGANYIIRPDGRRKRITEDLKEEICNEIQPGYKVERHLRDGDIVLFNRHPSLHKQSLMSHYVRVLKGKTFRIHPSAAFPYNADFDGDEVNIHSPQTEEARAEAKILLDIKNNMISSKNNTNFLGCIADAITGNYILGNNKFSKSDADQLLFSCGVINKLKDKEIKGTDLYSQILPENSGIKIPSVITSSNTLGSEDGELIKILDKKFGKDLTLETIRKSFRLGTDYLSRNGYTLALRDLSVSDEIKKTTDNVIKEAERKTEEIINLEKSGSLELIPGNTIEETRELKITQILNEVRTKIGNIVKDKFPKDSNVTNMISSGGGGSMLNITQIGCSVGQQSFRGQRINLGYNDRTLTFFEKNNLSPESHGFIKSSFFDGLKPTEFFFGAITGRDALMDTALRTPKSGYLYRRLVSALQDLKIEYDGTLRDASKNIVQFEYGGDGKDVSRLHLNKDISPGEAAGVVTAQSFGESSTQMVLNVFHSAGVAEMQVTLGLPRLIEIFDARKEPSTPMMEIYLNKEFNNQKDSTIFAEKIKEINLEEIVSEIKLNFSGKKIEIELDKKSLKNVHIGIQKVSDSLVEKGFEIKVKDSKIIVETSDLDFKSMYKFKEKLKSTIISGIKNVSQVVVAKRGKDFVVLTAGSNLKDLLEIKEVNSDKTTTNNIHEVAAVLGIECARKSIFNEVEKVLEGQGLDIDYRHLNLIADAMTSSGVVRGVTRMGIISHKSSIFARATFETPDKQFVNATIQGLRDELSSVIENIILNQPVPVGTGLPGLLVKVTGPLAKKEKSK